MGSGSQSAVSSKHAISTRKEFLTYKTHNEQQPEFVIVPVEKKFRGHSEMQEENYRNSLIRVGIQMKTASVPQTWK